MQNNFHNFSINYDFSSQNYKFNFEFMSLKSYLKKSQNYDIKCHNYLFFYFGRNGLPYFIKLSIHLLILKNKMYHGFHKNIGQHNCFQHW